MVPPPKWNLMTRRLEKGSVPILHLGTAESDAPDGDAEAQPKVASFDRLKTLSG